MNDEQETKQSVIGAALKAWIESNYKSKAQFARELGVSAQYVSGLCSGKAIGKDMANKMRNLFGLSSTFLLTGIGNIEAKDEDKPSKLSTVNVLNPAQTFSVDQSSLINAALAAKDGQIAAKDEVIRVKNAQIAQLQQSIQEKDQVIADLRRALTMLQYIQPDGDELKKHIVPFGAADEKEGVAYNEK